MKNRLHFRNNESLLEFLNKTIERILIIRLRVISDLGDILASESIDGVVRAYGLIEDEFKTKKEFIDELNETLKLVGETQANVEFSPTNIIPIYRHGHEKFIPTEEHEDRYIGWSILHKIFKSFSKDRIVTMGGDMPAIDELTAEDIFGEAFIESILQSNVACALGGCSELADINSLDNYDEMEEAYRPGDIENFIRKMTNVVSKGVSYRPDMDVEAVIMMSYEIENNKVEIESGSNLLEIGYRYVESEESEDLSWIKDNIEDYLSSMVFPEELYSGPNAVFTIEEIENSMPEDVVGMVGMKLTWYLDIDAVDDLLDRLSEDGHDEVVKALLSIEINGDTIKELIE